MSARKVFGIGLHKTGTKSLASALVKLGYAVTGPNFHLDEDLQCTMLVKALTVVGQFDAFQDTPWQMLYREMDERFPGSRFILTVRDEQEWLQSAIRYFQHTDAPARRIVYGSGSPIGNEEAWLAAYRHHNASALRHFQTRPQNLLVMDIAAGDGWGKLCRFLGLRRPLFKAFPFKNAGTRTQRPGGIKALAARLAP